MIICRMLFIVKIYEIDEMQISFAVITLNLLFCMTIYYI